MQKTLSYPVCAPSIVAFLCIIAVVGPIPETVAQERSAAWKERAQQSRQQYEQYMEQQREQIRAFAREQGQEFQAMIDRAQQAGIPRRLTNDTGEIVAVLCALSADAREASPTRKSFFMIY